MPSDGKHDGKGKANGTGGVTGTRAAAKKSAKGKGRARSSGGTGRGHAAEAKSRSARGTGERRDARAGRPARGYAPHGGIRPRGTLLIIGGHEDKEDDKLILRLLAERVGSGKLVIATVASEQPRELWESYEPLFRRLGVRHVHHLEVESREEAKTDAKLRVLDDAVAVFFTGGDQVKITSQLGDSPIYERLREIYLMGGIIAGTSAGASVMCETMLISGGGAESVRVGGAPGMAPGFGFISGVIIDQHFAERGRIGRLLGAVAQNPRMLGIGIDEDTAIVCDPGQCFTVVGTGAVYVVDGQDVSYTNLAEEQHERAMSVFGARLHVLTMGDRFDMETREPADRPAEELEKEILEGTKPKRARKRAMQAV